SSVTGLKIGIFSHVASSPWVTASSVTGLKIGIFSHVASSPWLTGSSVTGLKIGIFSHVEWLGFGPWRRDIVSVALL
ncbi:MAG TPA: hypothetical protein VMT00_03425, partial [Thermoanaerobaculia bacterium]|nr:hypothetical protein [Thermoanaerobaculia bacterium]